MSKTQPTADLLRFADLCAERERTLHDPDGRAAFLLRWEAFIAEIGEDRYNAASYAYEMESYWIADRAYQTWEDEQR